MTYDTSLFIFRRGLRLHDNTAMLKALDESDKVIPAFIMDDNQLEDNEYYSKNAAQFMQTSLLELNNALQDRGSHLYVFKGTPSEVVKDVIDKVRVDSVYVNNDYTPYSHRRDENIQEVCDENDVAFNAYHDYMLNPPEEIFTNAGTPYKVFTPYWKKARQNPVSEPQKNNFNNYYTEEISGSDPDKIKSIVTDKNPHIFREGGRDEALSILDDVSQYEAYENDREYPWKDRTTGLSPHNKFGTVSIREVYHTFKDAFHKKHGVIQELYWRDFYTQLAYHFPKVFGNNLKEKYDDVTWDEDEKKLQRWKDGETGYPIVDAGMRQLNKTGWMHNRVRMIVASFLIKDLHIHWRKGEQYFATQLVDYDPCVNNGSWQWAASTGADAQPYFRIFNPWSQQEDYDENAEYIKEYVPELQGYSADEIHKLNKERPDDLSIEKYPTPIVTHKEEREEALRRYKSAVK